MPAPKLSDQDVVAAIQTLDSWNLKGGKIARNLEFATFNDAIAFINRIAPLADHADHHPEIFNVYNRVELELTTHDSGGLTQKDFDLARQIDGVVHDVQRNITPSA